ncbi:MAG: hypothetical protein COA57_11445 [Flavobacteriales bacterium]|nr:MAG: hypothetical protein COA57_11445 [Flavobacteriales bacterium]
MVRIVKYFLAFVIVFSITCKKDEDYDPCEGVEHTYQYHWLDEDFDTWVPHADGDKLVFVDSAMQEVEFTALYFISDSVDNGFQDLQSECVYNIYIYHERKQLVLSSSPNNWRMEYTLWADNGEVDWLRLRVEDNLVSMTIPTDTVNIIKHDTLNFLGDTLFQVYEIVRTYSNGDRTFYYNRTDGIVGFIAYINNEWVSYRRK